MIIIGHHLINFNNFYQVNTIEDIKNCVPNSIVLFDFNSEEMLKYTIEENVLFALHVKNIKEACIANALKANYIVINENIAKDIQQIATEYLFDTKILLKIQNDAQIEFAAKNSIDGVIYENAIV